MKFSRDCYAPLRFAMLAVKTFINKQNHILWTIIFFQTLAIDFIMSREVLHSSVQCYRLNKNNPFISILSAVLCYVQFTPSTPSYAIVQQASSCKTQYLPCCRKNSVIGRSNFPKNYMRPTENLDPSA